MTKLACSQIPDLANQVFETLGKSGDFSIRQDEFESVCNAVAMVIENQEDGSPRSRAEEILHFKICNEQVYDLMMWFVTLATVVVAVCETEVCY